jgi:hypothetical protein
VTKTEVSMWNAILGFRRAVERTGSGEAGQITLADVTAFADDAGSRPPAGFRYVSGFATEHTISDSQR